MSKRSAEQPSASSTALIVAEQYDAAVRPDRFKCQYGALNRRLRSEIAAHGIYTNL